FRRIWSKQPRLVIPRPRGRVPLVVLDEIHKARGWKRTLKGLYDTLEHPADILVTGSARLAVYRKGSDSLLGRYLPFRLHPFSLAEVQRPRAIAPDECLEGIFERSRPPGRTQQQYLADLMEFGPFPEPLLAQDARKARLWRRTRVEAIIREDLRDLTRIPEFSRLEMMAALLPERVGSLFSQTSLAEDLEISPVTVKRWLLLLQEVYYLYEIKPYQKRIKRSLKKTGKVYLWDWSEVVDRAARFENLVAGHLLKACHFWTDTGEGDFELFFLRNKEKQEIDFLITRDGRPWLPVEVKLTDTTPSKNWSKFLPALACRRALQVVASPVCRKEYQVAGATLLVADAATVLSRLL
ncbi:MAG: hypothetical protein DRI34_11905, partial [Deltaproteobacteria bacterium]